MPKLFDTVLVANRGEIACRVIRTLRELGIRSVAVYSDADRGAKHVADADEAVRIGPAAPQASYLNIGAIIAAAQKSGAQAIHPGYGFLSENAEFAKACEAAGIVFIGPSVTALALMGDKIRAKQHVSQAGVPVIEGVSSPGLTDEQLEAAAIELGFPILVKPSAGGGGKGMQPVLDASELTEALATARRVALSAFGDDTLLLERLVTAPRHIEVQLLADTHGNVIHLGERECSLQRRHQKVIEEAPSPLLSEETRARIGEAACTVARSVDYVGAGTVEFLVSADAPDEFFFMEMNTRLQVEHPVTELVTGIDLVAWQLRVAAGQVLSIDQDSVALTGHAIEARVYAEDPERGFLPSTGTVVALSEASGEGVRVDSALKDGLVISPDYDPMLAKVIAWGADRAQALSRLDRALAETTVLGVRTNIEYLRALVADPDVQAGDLDTTLIERRLPELTFRHPDAAMLAAAARWLPEEAARARLEGSDRGGSLRDDRFAIPQGAKAWHSVPGWRTGGIRHPIRHRFATSAVDRVDVLVSGDTVTIDGVVIDGAMGHWTIARNGDTLWMGQAGFSWPLGIIGREAELREMLAAIETVDHPLSPEIRSPMPGTVVAVPVANGETVEAGQTVLTVEAMKMEHRLTAPVAGVVQISAMPGDLVKLDQLLASITQSIHEEKCDQEKTA
ncbi:MAG TPA: acetyl-CoA carboxylase biotin carboxylase subunit [Terrimesophilobacter sp.]|uniref:acetyl/propionyl/methylcrotonyl-CoA carboxylase subunit alpha n=1 Tax=Terrimesophilobacter sp. TaxID=2906435 RepID=UPI002F91F296